MITPHEFRPPGLHRERLAISAFTLIELLAVIMVVGLFAAVLVVGISRVREKARATQSVANMRQIALGMLLFANDNKPGRFPGSANQTPGIAGSPTWDVAVLPYMGADTSKLGYSRVQGLIGDKLPGLLRVFHCPLDSRPHEPNAVGAYPRSYSISPVVLNHGGRYDGGVPRASGVGVSITDVNTPGRFIILNRAPKGWELATNTVGSQNEHTHAGPNPDTPANEDFWATFRGRTPLAFADGHVDLLSPAQVIPINQRVVGYRIP